MAACSGRSSFRQNAGGRSTDGPVSPVPLAAAGPSVRAFADAGVFEMLEVLAALIDPTNVVYLVMIGLLLGSLAWASHLCLLVMCRRLRDIR